MFEIIGFAIAQVLLLAIGIVLGAICVLFVFLLTRNVANKPRQRVAIGIAFCFPVIALFYLEAGVVIRDFVRYSAGKDSILDGLVHYPLGNGYRLAFFDETAPEGGWIKDPRGGSLQVDGIHELQIAGDFLFIHADRIPQTGGVPTVTVIPGEPPPTNTAPLNVYIELNTKTHEEFDYSSLEELDRAAAQRNVQLQLVPLDEFYSEALSAAAPGWLFWGFMMTPIVIAGVQLLRGLLALRSRRPAVT